MKPRICKLCGELFEPKSPKQLYCNNLVSIKCEVCGKEFQSTCNPAAPKVCSKQCASSAAKLKLFTCAICGDQFHPNSSRQKYCKKPIVKVCQYCGNPYDSYCGDLTSRTCSKDCQQKLATKHQAATYQSTTKICKECGKEFHPTTNTAKYCGGPHFRTCAICGKEFEVFKINADTPKTCSKKCADDLKFIEGNPFSKPECREKAKQTSLKRYGTEYPMQNPVIASKIFDAYMKRTGYSSPMTNPEVRAKVTTSAKQSQFEMRIRALLEQYNIDYVYHYMLHSDKASHEFDFYLPKYKILVDCDGLYYHSYLDDPNGKHVIDYYDEDRLSLVPKDHIFHVIVEGQEEHDIKYLTQLIKSIDNNAFNYESELFKWCRSIEFPYPEYSEKRLRKDYKHLCEYDAIKYSPSCRLGDSTIQHFHHSIYDAHVGNCISPYEAWYNDDMLKRVITNRLIYKNEVDPFKILRGFNISKICPRVSVFNPVLAKYLTTKYLSDFDTVFDPFSGFSGRLLGVTATGKGYIGQDLNVTAVAEANEIIQFHALENCKVYVQDSSTSMGEYECLLTCPPYNTKETYADESVFHTCDEWVDIVLDNFTCRRYVFVVDETVKYKDKIKENIASTSHFCKTTEQVIVIDK